MTMPDPTPNEVNTPKPKADLPKAMGQIIEILSPLTNDDKERVLRAVAILFDIEAPV